MYVTYLQRHDQNLSVSAAALYACVRATSMSLRHCSMCITNAYERSAFIPVRVISTIFATIYVPNNQTILSCCTARGLVDIYNRGERERCFHGDWWWHVIVQRQRATLVRSVIETWLYVYEIRIYHYCTAQR